MDNARSEQATNCDAAAQNRNQQRGSHGQPALDERRVAWGSEPSIRIDVLTESCSSQCSSFLNSKAFCCAWMSLATAFS